LLEECLDSFLSSEKAWKMDSYYSLLEFESAPPLFLGKLPLAEQPDNSVAVDTYDGTAPAVTDGAVPKTWQSTDDKTATALLPEAADTADPFQVAPMASFYRRPHGDLPDVIGDKPDTVHVFVVDTDGETNISDVDVAAYTEEVVGERADGELEQINRQYEWEQKRLDTDDRKDAVGDFPAGKHVVGFVDGQDMHDPYTHLGVSSADSAPQALYDVLTQPSG
jgi:hypothetical protein